MPLEHLDEQDKHLHKQRLELARKMEENWRSFQHNRGRDERAWKKLSKAELEEMHTQISRWIQECWNELDARPSPEGKDTIVDDWLNSLTRKNTILKGLIDKAN